MLLALLAGRSGPQEPYTPRPGLEPFGVFVAQVADESTLQGRLGLSLGLGTRHTNRVVRLPSAFVAQAAR